MRQTLAVVVLLVAAACATSAAEPDAERRYALTYSVTPHPQRGTADIVLTLSQPRSLLREMSMSMPGSRFTNLRGDGQVLRRDGRVSWQPPAAGGTLRWTANLRHRRYGDAYDAWLGDDWGLFRATDIIPPARTRTLKGASSDTRLRFELPDGWSSVTAYASRDDDYRVVSPDRRYTRPAGWMLIGRLGVRIESIAGVRVLVAGPTGQSVRRMDMLALLHWTLPELRRILPEIPTRVLIVSAGADMWYGGLSGPRSMFLHADLPLISENGTSTLLHELMHVATGLRAADGADWIVEGLAEYYGLELLRRTRSMSAERYADTLAGLADWAGKADKLCTSSSTGAVTARAVTTIARVRDELRDKGVRGNPLDEVLRRLVAADQPISVARLRRVAAEVGGSPLESLANLPGCNA